METTPDQTTPTTAFRAGLSPEIISGRLDRLPFLPLHLRTASILGTGTFFDAFDSLSIAGVLTMIVATFRISMQQVGVLGSAAFAGQFVGALIFGWLGEIIGRKWAFIISLAIFGACSAFAATALSLHALVVARTIQGIGLGAEVPIAAALFSEFVRGNVRGRWLMVYETIFVWGLVAAPVVALVAVQGLGPALAWRVIFALGGIPLLVAAIAIFALPESPRWLAAHGRLAEADAIVSEMEAEARQLGKPLLDAIPSPPIVKESTSFIELFRGIYAKRTFVIWTQWFCAYFVNNGYQIWLPTLYMKYGGLPITAALALTIVSNVVGLAVAYLTAAVVDFVGRKPWFAGGFAVSTLFALGGAFAVGVLHIHGWVPLLVFGVGMNAGASINALGAYLYTPEQYPTRMRAWGTAAGTSLNRVGSFFAPLAVGALLAASAEGIGNVFLMFAVVALFAAIVIWTLGEETKRRTLEEISP